MTLEAQLQAAAIEVMQAGGFNPKGVAGRLVSAQITSFCKHNPIGAEAARQRLLIILQGAP